MKKEEKLFAQKVEDEYDVERIVKIEDQIKKADAALEDEQKEIINE